ncbi:hypothetical protein ABVT39_023476 [Epinephelus coioides]
MRCAASVSQGGDLSLARTHSFFTSLPLWEKPEQEESSRRGEEADCFFFFFRYSGGGGGRIFREINQKDPRGSPPPSPVRSGRGREKPHGCASESAADTALRTLLMPRL